MARVKTGVKDIKPIDLVDKARYVVTQMTGNPHFPAPTPPLAEVESAIDTLFHAIIDAMNRDTLKISYRRSKEKELRQLLTALAGYVQSVSQGDALIIESSGFGVVRRSANHGKLEPPTHFRALISNNHGLVKLRWKPVRGAKGYMIYSKEVEKDDNSEEWQVSGFCTRSAFMVNGLERATLHSFKVIPVNRAGFGAPSQVVTSVVP